MKKKKVKDHILTLRIETMLANKLDRHAKKQGRPLANLVRKVLEDYVKRRNLR